MGILWIIIIGLVAGLIARWLSPGPNSPSGFILTVVLGIAGAFLATWIGQAIGWYRPDQGAGFIGATIGAVLVCCLSGTAWSLRGSYLIPGPGRVSQARQQLRRCGNAGLNIAARHFNSDPWLKGIDLDQFLQHD